MEYSVPFGFTLIIELPPDACGQFAPPNKGSPWLVSMPAIKSQFGFPLEAQKDGTGLRTGLRFVRLINAPYIACLVAINAT